MAGCGAVRRHTVITSDGVGLAVEERGPLQAEHTVVMVHGFCLSQLSWAPQIRLLRRRFGDRVRIVSYDHRGHGRSDSADMASYTIEQLARDLAAVLDAVAVAGRCTLVGHSMGAMTLLAYHGLPAGARPVDPDALVLVATAAGRLAQLGVGRLLGLPLIGVLADVVAHTPHCGGDKALRTLVRPVCRTVTRVCGFCDAERETLTSVCADAVYSTPLTTAVGFLPALKRFDAYAVLGSIAARTTVINGGADVLTPPAHAHDLVAGIPGATHRHIPAAGHMLLHEAPHTVTAEIARTIIDPGLRGIGNHAELSYPASVLGIA